MYTPNTPRTPEPGAFPGVSGISTLMNHDLTPFLDEWPYQPGQLTARIVRGLDGSDKVQVRLDLGILQLNADGHPAGNPPPGYPSLLEYLEDQIDAGRDGAGREGESDQRRQLTPEECRQLREEAVQYYHRYLALLVLEDFDRVVRDTTRNLRVLDLCAKHAEEDDDQEVLEQFRPYIVMVRARALASRAILDDEPRAAIVALDDALDALQRHFVDAGLPQAFEQSNEVQMLRGMRDSLTPKLPVSPQAELRERLRQAITHENYELAAILRDELKQFPEKG